MEHPEQSRARIERERDRLAARVAELERERDVAKAAHRVVRVRLAELERELQDTLMTCAAIIAKYGDRAGSDPEVRSVFLVFADMERIKANPPTVYREDGHEGVRLRLELRSGG